MKYRILLLFIFCASPLYAAHKNKPFSWPTGHISSESFGINCNVDIMDENQTVALFDGHGHKLVRKKSSVIPITITITNTDSTPITFATDSCSVPLVNPYDYLRIYTRTTRLFSCLAGTGIALAIAPALGLGIGMLIVPYVTAPAATVGIIAASVIGSSILLVPTGGALGHVLTNGSDICTAPAISCMYQKSEIIIQPGQTQSCIAFIDYRNIHKPFTIAFKYTTYRAQTVIGMQF